MNISVLNHLLISRCDAACEQAWNGTGLVLTPDRATQKLVASQNIACNSETVPIERMDANWLRNIDN